MALQGYIYRGRKPVHWSPSSRTALAEAELEVKLIFISCYFSTKSNINLFNYDLWCSNNCRLQNVSDNENQSLDY